MTEDLNIVAPIKSLSLILSLNLLKGLFLHSMLGHAIRSVGSFGHFSMNL